VIESLKQYPAQEMLPCRLENPKDAEKHSEQRGIASKNACHCSLNLVELTLFRPLGALRMLRSCCGVRNVQLASCNNLEVAGTEEARKTASART
jgi:hypothetical protein